MSKSNLFVIALCAGLGTIFVAESAQAEFPVRGDVKFVFNLSSGPSNGRGYGYGGYGSYGNNALPWYLYFPVDPYAPPPGQGQTALPPNRFPGWPGCFPPPDAAQCCPGNAPCPGPGGVPLSRRFPDWPVQQPQGLSNAQPQFASYGQQGGVMPVGYSMIPAGSASSYGPVWPTAPVYPAAWQGGYYYGR
jgi:hypothetical protein